MPRLSKKLKEEAEKAIGERIDRRERIQGEKLDPKEIQKIRTNEIKDAREGQIRNRIKKVIGAILAAIGIRSSSYI